jgi:hypothetical protein
MSPLEFMQRLASLIPSLRLHLTLHGVVAAHTTLCAQRVRRMRSNSAPAPPGSAQAGAHTARGQHDGRHQKRTSCSQLMPRLDALMSTQSDSSQHRPSQRLLGSCAGARPSPVGPRRSPRISGVMRSSSAVRGVVDLQAARQAPAGRTGDRRPGCATRSRCGHR